MPEELSGSGSSPAVDWDAGVCIHDQGETREFALTRICDGEALLR